MARDYIKSHLYMLHPSHLQLLELCQRTDASANGRCIGQMLMVDFKKLRPAGPLDQHQLRNNVTIELERSQEFVKTIWYPNFANIYLDKASLNSIKSSQMDSFYRSVTVLASNQVCFLST